MIPGRVALTWGRLRFSSGRDEAYSTRLSMVRASPWAAVERKSRISSFRVTERAAAPRLPSSSSSGRPSWRSLRTCSRESSWRVTLKEGFSVVVAIMVRSPDSSNGRKKSCCAFEKRCSSSSTRISTPVSWRRSCCNPASGALRRRTGCAARAEQEGQRGFAAARRAEQEQAWKARAFQERGQALGEVALSDEESQFGGAQAFRQRLRQGHEGSNSRQAGYRCCRR